jgi:hypothetical protein
VDTDDPDAPLRPGQRAFVVVGSAVLVVAVIVLIAVVVGIVITS